MNRLAQALAILAFLTLAFLAVTVLALLVSLAVDLWQDVIL